MNDYFRMLLETINTSIENLDERTFDLMCNDVACSLKNGHKVVATGLGKNVPICEKFEGTMLSLGLNARFLHTNTAVHGDLGAVKNGDTVLILSKSGETIESVNLLTELKKRDVTIWAITFNDRSTLALNADRQFIISMDHEGDDWNIVPNNSTTLYLIVLQALAISVSRLLSVTLDDFRMNHPGGHIGVQLRNE